MRPIQPRPVHVVALQYGSGFVLSTCTLPSDRLDEASAPQHALSAGLIWFSGDRTCKVCVHKLLWFERLQIQSLYADFYLVIGVVCLNYIIIVEAVSTDRLCVDWQLASVSLGCVGLSSRDSVALLSCVALCGSNCSPEIVDPNPLPGKFYTNCV